MRKFYLAFPILGTASPKLTWSHYFELLKCDNSLEMQFYYKECIKEGWKVRELKRLWKTTGRSSEGLLCSHWCCSCCCFCLPFAIEQSKVTECKFYSLTGIDNVNNCITLGSYEEGAEIPAGTPVLFKMNEGQQTLSISAQNADLVIEPVAGTNKDVNLVGSFIKIGGKDNPGLYATMNRWRIDPWLYGDIRNLHLRFLFLWIAQILNDFQR